MRLAIGGPMLLYGVSKLFNGIAPIQELLVSKGLPGFFGYGVYAGELVAPILVLLGYRTRLASAIFAINAITALLLAQASTVFTLNGNGGWSAELLGMYFTIALALVFTGGGKYALSSSNVWD